MAEKIRQILSDSPSARWGALLIVSFTMMMGYFITDVMSPLEVLLTKTTAEGGLGWSSSDYGFLAREVFDPRPNYFAVLLWNRLMGTTVYDTAEPLREGAHVFAHSRKDGKEGEDAKKE